MAFTNRPVTPANIAANQDDYNPGSGSFFLLTATTPINITGLASGAAGLIQTFVNVGSNAITFTHQDSASTAANRLLISDSTSLVISGGQSVTFQYIAGSINRWYTVGAAKSISGAADMSIGGTVTSGTAGSLLFVGSGPVLAQDNANLFWDDTNNRLGILNVAPAAALSVGSSSQFQVSSAGAIGAATGVTSSGTITFSGFSSNGGPLYTNASGVLAQTTAGTATQVLHGGATPSFSAVSLTADVSGILPIANGGTGSATQNFVDLTTAQSVAGVKTFSDAVYANAGVDRSAAATLSLGVTNASAVNISKASANTTIGGSLIVTENLTVNGTTTTINSSVVDITDRVIHVNHTTGTVAVPSAITGWSIHRGNNGTTDRDHAGLFWTGDSGAGLGITTGTFRLAANTAGDDSALTTDLDLRLNSLDVRGNYTTTGSGSFTAGSGAVTLPGLGLGIVHSSSGGLLSSSLVVLTSEVSGILPVANGGTGASTLTANGVVVGNGTSAVHITAVGTSGHVLTSNGAGNNPTFQAVSAATLTIGSTSITSGTAGRILFEGAGNVVSQDADLSFATDTLTATKIIAPTSVTISALTAGSVVFAGTAGLLSQDNANLFWDNTNDRLGILTASPSAALSIGSASEFTVSSGGAVTAATGLTSSGTITLSAFSSAGGPLYTNGSGVVAQVTAGTSTQVLHGGATPSFSAVSLTADVSGTLPVGNGGTGTATAFTTGSIVFAGASGVYSQDNANLFWDNTNDRLGLLTTSPSSAIGISGNAARTIQMERHTTADTAGNALTVLAGSATSAATDKNGGNLILSSGTATGTGSSAIAFQVATAGGTGTADRAPATKMTLTGAGELVPPTDDTGVIGTDSLRWNRIRANNVVTGDLHMMAPDGSAYWKLVEHADGIYAFNMMTGKKYAISLKPIED